MTLPISFMASILMPERVVATFTDEQTLLVLERALGMEAMRRRSDSVIPL